MDGLLRLSCQTKNRSLSVRRIILLGKGHREGFDIELSRLRSVILTIATASFLYVMLHVKSKGVFATGFEEELWVGHLSTIAQSALQIHF